MSDRCGAYELIGERTARQSSISGTVRNVRWVLSAVQLGSGTCHKVLMRERVRVDREPRNQASKADDFLVDLQALAPQAVDEALGGKRLGHHQPLLLDLAVDE